MAIRNVVFDYGQVMIHFDPAYMAAQVASAPEDIRLLAKVVFDRLYWDKLDSGALSDEEVLDACRQRLPQRLWKAAEELYGTWFYHTPPVAGMRELVSHLRKRYGVSVYLLSNIPPHFARQRETIPVLGEFDGCVLSGELGIIKPDRAIFAHLCTTYGLIPEETVFIDDSPRNIAGAEAYGIQGYRFDGDADRLKRYLEDILG